LDELWTKNYILLTVSVLLLFSSFYLLIPTLPLFIQHLGGTEAQVGLIMGVFTIAAVFGRPIIGGLNDLFGRKMFAIIGLIAFSLVMFSHTVIVTIAMLFIIRILHGFAWATSTTSIGTAVIDVIPVDRRGEGVGWYGMAMSTAMAFGPMLGIFFIEQYSFVTLFIISASLPLISILLVSLAQTPFKRPDEKMKIVIFDKSLTSISIVIFLLTFTYGGIMTFLPLFAYELQVNAGNFFLIYAITLIAIRPVAGVLSDRKGEAFVIVPSLIIVIVGLIVLAFSTSLFDIIATAILYGVGFGAAQPALQAATLRIVAADRKGVANASFLTAFDFGIGFGSIILGVVSQQFGFTTLFISGSVVALGSLLLFMFTVKRKLRFETGETV